MPSFLSTTDADFEARFTAQLGMKREEAEDVDQAVSAIIADVRARGDAAVHRLRLDHVEVRLAGKTLRRVREIHAAPADGRE